MRRVVVAGPFVALGALAVAACVAGCPAPRDVVPVSRDVRVDASAPPDDTYEYVAKRPHGAIGLAESRHMTAPSAQHIIDVLADDLEACARRLEADGALVEGAARIIVAASELPKKDSGATALPPRLNVRLSPGNAVAANALLCVIAPVRAVVFPPSTDGAPPAFAIEISWQPVGVRDGGAPIADEIDGEAPSP